MGGVVQSVGDGLSGAVGYTVYREDINNDSKYVMIQKEDYDDPDGSHQEYKSKLHTFTFQPGEKKSQDGLNHYCHWIYILKHPDGDRKSGKMFPKNCGPCIASKMFNLSASEKR